MAGIFNAFKVKVVVKDAATQTDGIGLLALEKSGKYCYIFTEF